MTNEELIQKVEELTRKVQELENWKAQKTLQQISFPLDKPSINAIVIGGTNDIAKGLQNAGYIIT